MKCFAADAGRGMIRVLCLCRVHNIEIKGTEVQQLLLFVLLENPMKLMQFGTILGQYL